MPFANVGNRANVYVCGVIVDIKHKLRVVIENFVNNPTLVVGVYVRIMGEYRPKGPRRASFVSVKNIADVTLEAGVAALPTFQLEKIGLINPH
ncbi:uncharacterized protein LOC123270404 isoform X2 [Cotesia glomerata]|uniref:Uncharacterized protein n=1 Tax=Cotesia glomerata TaxID=32391 RepID=A0AAV7IGT7_COTGL|nr:uncharacterized protein LOC123270404 isoform X2 [Cotesia glomerata]KAH0552499.1 hypothetical protein KQX54_011231 [Cotesia glomerata]